ncbi:creatininase family protein [Bacillus gobiensis]|uniref:creatininase family protein n=1 Tax=Bacillus gobiensis TaxID=1441095 RepID=UPI003D19DF47
MIDSRYQGIAFEKRFLPRLTTMQIKEMPKEDALLVLPIGATEQHGPHLPVYTDTLLGEGLLNLAFTHLENENVWLLPPIPYGKSNEHFGLAGTITLSAATLQAVVMDIAKSVSESGFKKIVLFNSHGGNHDLLNMMAREIRIETGLMVFRLNSTAFDVTSEVISEKEQKFGIHGGEVETSMVLDLKESWVQMKYSTREFPKLDEDSSIYLKGGCYFAWLTNDISESGIAGDASLGTKQKGEQFNEKLGIKIAKVLLEMSHFDLCRINQ